MTMYFNDEKLSCTIELLVIFKKFINYNVSVLSVCLLGQVKSFDLRDLTGSY